MEWYGKRTSCLGTASQMLAIRFQIDESTRKKVVFEVSGQTPSSASSVLDSERKDFQSKTQIIDPHQIIRKKKKIHTFTSTF